MDVCTAAYSRLESMVHQHNVPAPPRTQEDEDRMAMETMVLELEGPEALARCRQARAARQHLRFDGPTFVQAEDGERLARQLDKVRAFMSDGDWHSLHDIADRCHGSEASVSARLRDLRKDRFGGHVIERRREEGGLYLYRMDREGGEL